MPAKKKPSVLIIDPDVRLTEILARRFHLDGWTVRVAHTWQRAERLIASAWSDVVLVDPGEESDWHERLQSLGQSAKASSRLVIVHAASLGNTLVRTWKQVSDHDMIRKGEYSLADFVKRLKKLKEGFYGNTKSDTR